MGKQSRLMLITSAMSLLLVCVSGQNPIHNCGCIFTTPQGSTYDLSAFAQENTDYTLHSPDGHYEYTIAICRNLPNIQPSCAHHHFEPAYANSIQVDKRYGYCFVTGDIRHAYAEQAHNDIPEHGVDIVYPLGSMCADNRPRELRIHFVCAPHHDVSAHPKYVSEAAEKCHYNVTWPSKYACPLASAGLHQASWLGWAWGWWSTLSLWWYGLFLVYAVVGCCWNAVRGKADIGWAAMPHKTYWQQQYDKYFPDLLKDWAKLPGIRHVLGAVQRVGVVVAVIAQAIIIFFRTLWSTHVSTRLSTRFSSLLRRNTASHAKKKTPSASRNDMDGPSEDDAMLWADEDE